MTPFRIVSSRRAARAGLSCCTALAGSLLGLAAPGAALAQDGCTTSDDGAIVDCAARPDKYKDGIELRRDDHSTGYLTFYIVQMAPGADVVTKTADGLYVTNLYGEAAVVSRDNLVSTSGDGHSGVVVHSAGGHATANMGDVATTGKDAAGIVASAGVATDPNDPAGLVSGNIYAFANSVSTRGDNAVGIATQISGKPDNFTNIAASSIATRGALSHGVDAIAESGNMDIHLGTVSTTGSGAVGVRTSSQQISAVEYLTADKVTTGGVGAHGIDVIAAGLVNMTMGSVATTGAGAYGVQSTALYGANTVKITSVSTRGAGAVGIATQTDTGFNRLTAGSVTTAGEGAVGITALSKRGDILLAADTVRTYGANAEGIQAVSSFATTEVKAGSVQTKGDNAVGIRAGGGRGVTLNADKVATSGNDAAGLILTSGNADVGDVINIGPIAATVGSITTAGSGSTGIFVNSVQNLDLTVGSARTYGTNAAGVVANTGVGNGTIKVGSVTTSGDSSIGVSLGQIGSLGRTRLNASIDTISTTGADSVGVNFYAGATDATLTLNKSVRTQGSGAAGAVISGRATRFDVTNAGYIYTRGAAADGLSFDINNAASTIRAGTIATTGAGSAGVRLVARDNDNFDLHSAITLSATKITTTGEAADGIAIDTGREVDSGGVHGRSAGGNDGPLVEHVAVTSGSVAVTGQGSAGIRVRAYGDATIDATATSSVADSAIDAVALGHAGLTVRGITKGGGAQAVALTGADVDASILAGGSITGTGDALVVGAAGPYVPQDDGGDGDGGGDVGIGFRADTVPTARIANAGTLTGGSGYAVRSTAGRVDLNNSGKITGAVRFGEGDDLFTNAGSFTVTKDSDFGAGADRFVNSGTLRFERATTPLQVTFNGLERFENSGLIEMRNGVAGDTLTLPGDYVGTGNATLGLDVGSGATDRLVVTGAATGSTKILLKVSAKGARLIATPENFVTVGSGNAADAFTIGNDEVGLVRYALAAGPEEQTLKLAATAASPVYRLAKTGEAAQAIWHQSTDAWSTHMAALRDAGSTGGAGQGRLWGQAFGKLDSRRQTQTIAPGTTTDLGYNQDYFGGEIGLDAGTAGPVALGAQGGYISSTMRLRAGPERVSFDSANAGAYLSLHSGPIFANLLGQYAHYWLTAKDRTLGYHASAGGNGYGARLELGVRAGDDGLFAEPMASIAWQRADIGGLSLLDQRIDDLGGTALTGRFGGRVGGTIAMGAETRAIVYARGAYVHEFRGRSDVLFASGGTDLRVPVDRIGDYGTVAVGANIVTQGPVSGFIEAEGSAGSSASGGGGRVGLRFRL